MTKRRTVLQMVQAERKQLPQLGGKKLYYQLHQQPAYSCLKVGRDKLFSILREYDLLVKHKRRYVTTTNSKHWLYKYPNLARNKMLTGPEQLWVSDITYVKTDEGNCYLNLVTDAFSRRIMGYAIADTMSADVMKKAYEMALGNRVHPPHSLMHHSDRGLQYCSAEYVTLSKDNDVQISMTENGDPYENALAERINRTLKEEFGLGRLLPSRQKAYRLAEEAIYLYNNRRPHWSLKMKTPNQVHLQKIPIT